MLAAHPVPTIPHPAARPRLRIYSPSVRPPKPGTETPAPRTGELQPIGQLLPQVLARYLSPRTIE